MFSRFKKKPAPVEQKKPKSAFSTDVFSQAAGGGEQFITELPQPTLSGVTMDSNLDGSIPDFKGGAVYGIPDSQGMWYASQGFIGYPMCALIAKHWLVDKACGMPARDAIRQGYNIDCDHAETIELLRKRDSKMKVNKHMRDLIHFGRVFGGRVAIFVVESTDPDYYVKPFNLDGVTPNSYKGISQVDPSWVTPDLTSDNLSDPASLNFYEPTYYWIGQRRYHKSHLHVFAPYPVPDLMKQTYNFFGVSVPERIYERVYAAERTANEAPQLAMTKRLLTMGVPGLEMVDKHSLALNLQDFMSLRDNFGVHVSDGETTFNQFDTALADLDTTIMTQYQLVAAGANVPATKLLGTTPKGFNSSGEYEEAVYREELESIQTNDLEPLLERHYRILAKSMGLGDHELSIQWNPLDSPTAKEYAEINEIKARTAAAYYNTGAIDGHDIREQLKLDKESDFFGVEVDEDEDYEPQ